jgi:hypothetical protein
MQFETWQVWHCPFILTDVNGHLQLYVNSVQTRSEELDKIINKIGIRNFR